MSLTCSPSNGDNFANLRLRHAILVSEAHAIEDDLAQPRRRTLTERLLLTSDLSRTLSQIREIETFLADRD